MCNSSGIENENEIYSCAQLEAQQEQHSKSVEASSNVGASSSNLRAASTDSSDSATTPKVAKRDNIVLGISDLKPQQQRKSSIENAKNVKSAPKPIIVDKSNKQEIVPITTIKVNNCEIISRPRSVTASIFEHPTILAPSKSKTGADTKAPVVNKTKQVFRPSNQIHPAPTSVTSSIFAPRTKDMNPG